MRFDGFTGNEKAKGILSAYVDAGRFPHALLLEGEEGSGRRTLGRLIACAAVCGATQGTEKPCGVCPACHKALAGGHPDISEAGGDGAARSFHIDAVRAIRDLAYVLPNEAPRRVFLLAGAHLMTEQAQNALLKILEEPPEHAVFILTCENRSQLLPTILSRTVCLAVEPPAAEEAERVLGERLPDTSEEDRRRALALFGGNIGQALDGLADGTLRRVLELAPQFAVAVAAPNELELLRLTGSLEKDKETADGLLSALSLIFRDALTSRFGGKTTLSSSHESAALLARTLTKPQLAGLLHAVEELQYARVRNMNYTLFLTLLCARLRRAAGK